MATADFVEQHWPKMALALLLTFASGLVDITGYLGIFHLFTAHLTGTTAQFGHLFLVAIWIFYVVGAAVGTWVFKVMGLAALLVAITLLFVGFVTDQISPLSI